MRAHRHSSGLSAIELLVVLAIAGIAMTLGAPALGNLVTAHRLTTAVNDLFIAVNLTRSEALQRGQRVDLVPAGDGTSWTNGWVVLIDANANHKLDAGELVIQRFAAPARGIAITQRFAGAAPYLAYNASGRTRTNASSQQPNVGHWLFESHGKKRKLIVSFVSRARTCDAALPDC